MDLLNLATSLELAKKLKALKVKQESLWYWACFYHMSSPKYPQWEWVLKYQLNCATEYYSAYTSDELDYLLDYYKKQKQNITIWVRGYPIQQYILDTIKDNDRVNTKAKRLIYLIENKYLVI